jgi:hypothetical protein
MLLDFLVRLMLAAKRAEFAELQPLGFGLLVLGLAVVFPFALSALQCDNLAHVAPFQSLRIQNSEVGIQKKEPAQSAALSF